MFVHDSLSELVMYGETEVGAANFRIKMNTLRKPIAGDPSGATGFQRQFEVATCHALWILFACATCSHT